MKGNNVNGNLMLWLLIFLLVATTFCVAQTDTIYYTKPVKSINFHFMPSFSKMLKFNHYSTPIIKQRVAYGFGWGVNYNKKIKKNTYLGVGLNSNFNMVQRLFFTAHIPTYNIDFEHQGSNDVLFPYFQVPISFSNKNIVKKRRNTHINYSMGIAMNYIVAYEYGGNLVSVCDEEWGNCEDIFDLYITNEKPLIVPSILGKLGFFKITKRGGYSYGINLIGNYSPIPVGKGNYAFNNINQESYGNVELRLNYIGLELVQGITLKKDNSISLYEKDKLFILIHDSLEAKTQLKFSIMPMVFGGMKVKPEAGEKILESRPSKSIAGGVSYYQKLNDNLGLNIGVQIGGVSEHQRVNMLNYPNPDNKNKHSYSWSNYLTTHYIGIPTSLQMTLKEKKLYSIIGEVGFSSMYIKPYRSIGSSTWSYGEFGSDISELDSSYLGVDIKSTSKFAFGVFSKVGIVKKTQNSGSSIETNLVVHYSPTTIAEGEYSFTSEATKFFKEGRGNGTISHSINYIGLELVYGLTVQKKKK